ncbi:Uncharacterised protein [Yersinia frederiksenii]|nr:Uncharacterised protein [Yersinia frederiksenii]
MSKQAKCTTGYCQVACAEELSILLVLNLLRLNAHLACGQQGACVIQAANLQLQVVALYRSPIVENIERQQVIARSYQGTGVIQSRAVKNDVICLQPATVVEGESANI